MVTRKVIEQTIANLSKELQQAGLRPKKIVLFGSYPKGLASDTSDIDVAVWADEFTSFRTNNLEKIAPITSHYPSIELHTFASSEDEKSNPFILEILATGIDYSRFLTDDNQ